MQAADHILLTGAGFTHNFGAPLARDVWNLIFNHPEVQGAPNVRGLFLENQDFEEAYNITISDSRFTPADRQAIQSAVREAFEYIDRTVRDWLFTVNSPHPVNVYGVQKFISRFAGSKSRPGLYFTLNQDLFLERHYYNGERPAMVGIQHHPDWFSSRFLNQKLGHEHWRNLTSTALDVSGLCAGHSFLYVKLHGSSNWFSSDGHQRMVIGRGKLGQIAAEPLLAAYWELFTQVLTSGNRRIFVIGYGFCDEHVNQVLAKAIDGNHIELFVLSQKPASDLKATMQSKPFGDRIWKGLRGYFSGTLLDVFPADQSESAMWRDINRKFFSAP